MGLPGCTSHSVANHGHGNWGIGNDADADADDNWLCTVRDKQ